MEKPRALENGSIQVILPTRHLEEGALAIGLQRARIDAIIVQAQLAASR